MKLQEAIKSCIGSINAFVFVGGSIIRKREALSHAIGSGVRVRFLFPNPRSEWFKSYIQSAGLSINDYSERVCRNSALAEQLGSPVEVRKHDFPVHSWFVIVDNELVFTKPIAFFSQVPIRCLSNASIVNKFLNNFERTWINQPQNRKGARCFLSYAREDNQIAVNIRNQLLRNRIDCWRDVDNIPKGANWDLEIQTALDKCSHVLLVATQNSLQSENVADEIGYAKSKGKTIIPLILEKMTLPLRVHRAQGIEFIEDFDVGMELLLGILR